MKRRAFLGLGAAAVATGAGWALLRPASPGRLLRSTAPLPPRFQARLPIPATRQGTAITVVQREADLDILPGLKTRAWTYDGTFPGPTIVSRSGTPTVVTHRNELPEPTVVHLHGGHTPAESDGYPIDLLLPVNGGSGHQHHGDMMVGATATGERAYRYPMRQRAATLWYHDHRMGATAPAVWRGLAGFHLVRDDEEEALPLPAGDHDVPLMIADRSFAEDGSFRYTADHVEGVLGDVVLVNGAPWPVLEVSPVRYRLRILNASNARRYRLALDPPPPGGDPFTQVGSDGGLLAAPVTHDVVDAAPAERFDVVVDFARWRPGTRVRLVDRLAGLDVMRFDVTGARQADDSTVPAVLSRTLEPLGPPKRTRTFRFRQSADGTWTINDEAYRPGRALANPRLGEVERWRFLTDFHHPVHLHLDPFQVLSRNGRGVSEYDMGWKDTVDVRPAEAVEVAVRFTDHTGTFLLHCHNLEHEDMAMMADFTVE
ncbi:multicopper oxidase family protein [Dactylosporangium sp. AC04546]|uniref:multicopper oxidase family protein n=1 Tax=Dactylosporangium sp. AC04546 TaxID=2862460 RepID=UPI001EDEBB31|nr:multicopper oxidase family protein [Dactylosporangium sp. AC04546]WVK87461.1 multicopper oxidase family protein [Dactylosporangium sp. AC04546]